jgi:hypothetical protein
MNLFNILVTDKSPELARIRLAALCIVLLMTACAFGEKAHAAVECGLKASQRAVSTQCWTHPQRAANRGAQTPAQVGGSAANDGVRLTPLSSIGSPVRPAAAAGYLGGAPAAEASFAAPPLNRHAVIARAWESRGALGEVMPSAPAPAFSAAALSPPVAWSILLAGLFGLFAITWSPTVARAQSWAAVFPAHSGRRSGSRASALDRLDAARYAQAPAHGDRQGHFVRTVAASRFG